LGFSVKSNGPLASRGNKPGHGLSLAEVPKNTEHSIKRTGESLMASITVVAKDFFAACETGKGWEVCRTYCTPNATFAAQAEPLAEIKTLAEYADWMKGLMTIMPDGSYEVKSFATDSERNNVAAYAVFSGTHTGPGGQCEPTGKKTTSDYVYVMQFAGDKISHMTKIWHSGMALKALGWV